MVRSGRGGARAATAVLAGALVLVGVAACQRGPESIDEPGATPTASPGKTHEVDVCGLLPEDRASTVVGRQLGVVGKSYQAARVPTFSCELGTSFDDPVVTVTLTQGPVATDVFTKAYGEEAGGDPVHLQLGEKSFLRSEKSLRTLRVLAHGSVVSLSTPLRAGRHNQVTRHELMTLSKIAIHRLPKRAILKPASAGSRCGSLGVHALSRVLRGTPVFSSGFAGAHDSLMCSWAGLPGAVMIVVDEDPTAVQRARRHVDQDTQTPIPDLSTHQDVDAWSGIEVPGDLQIFVGHTAMVQITVVPPAGYADARIPPSKAELQLARAVLDKLGLT